MGLRIASTSIIVLAFILDIAGNATYKAYLYSKSGYYSDDWAVGIVAERDPLSFRSRPKRC